ncbi:MULTISPECIES: morphogenic membrane protein MmpA [unclassified Streptomyces]
MRTHRAPDQSAHHAARPAERAVVAGLTLAVGAGLAWIGGMIYTIAGWSG